MDGVAQSRHHLTRTPGSIRPASDLGWRSSRHRLREHRSHGVCPRRGRFELAYPGIRVATIRDPGCPGLTEPCLCSRGGGRSATWAGRRRGLGWWGRVGRRGRPVRSGRIRGGRSRGGRFALQPVGGEGERGGLSARVEWMTADPGKRREAPWRMGRVDGLIHNVGGNTPLRLDQMLELNLSGIMGLTRALLRR